MTQIDRLGEAVVLTGVSAAGVPKEMPRLPWKSIRAGRHPVSGGLV